MIFLRKYPLKLVAQEAQVDVPEKSEVMGFNTEYGPWLTGKGGRAVGGVEVQDWEKTGEFPRRYGDMNGG